MKNLISSFLILNLMLPAARGDVIQDLAQRGTSASLGVLKLALNEQELKSRLQSTPKASRTEFDAAIAIHQRHTQNLWQSQAGIEAVGLIWQGTIMATGATIMVASGGLATPIVAPIALGVASAGTNAFVDNMKARLHQSAAQDLGQQLALYREKTKSDFRELVKLDPESAYRKIQSALDSGLNSDDMQFMSPESKEVFVQHEISLLKDAYTQGQALQNLKHLAAQKYNAKQFEIIRKEHKDLVQFTTGFVQQYQSDMNEVLKEQAAIKANLEILNDETGKNKDAIMATRMFLLSNMSIREQKAAVKGGLFPDLSADQKKALIDSLDRRQTLAQKAEDLINTAGQVAQVLQVIPGMDPKLANDINTAVKYGTAAVNIAGSIASGNYVGAVMQVAGLFGGSGPSPEAAMHAQVMGMLSEILRGQQLILAELREGFTKVLQAQQRTMEMIAELSIQVAESHEKIMSRLVALKDVTYASMEMINSELYKDTVTCLNLSRDAQTDVPGQRFKGAFLNYPALESFVNGNVLDTRKCHSGIRTIFSERDHTGEDLFFIYNPTSSDIEAGKYGYKSYVFDPLVRFAQSKIPSQVLASVYLPSLTVSSVHQKIKAVSESSSGQEMDENELRRLLRALVRLISLKDLSREVHKVLGALPFLEIYSHTYNRARTLQEAIVGDSNDAQYLEKVLNRALDYIDLGLAQQALVSGDILLPYFYENHPAAETRNSVEEPANLDPNFLVDLTLNWSNPENEIFDLVTRSPLLAKNYLMYALNRDAYESSKRDAFRLSLYKYMTEIYRPSLFRTPSVRKAISQIKPDEDEEKRTRDLFSQIFKSKKWELHFANVPTPVYVRGDKVTESIPEKDQQGWIASEKPAGVSLRLGRFFFPLPDFHELQMGKLENSNATTTLMQLRAEVIKAKSNLTILRRSDVNHRETLIRSLRGVL